jgi:TolB-like protein
MSFWGELRRRNVVKVGTAYAIVAWLLIQVASDVFPALQLPAWTVTFVTALLIIGFPIALILAWAYELTPEGIKKTHQVSLEESIRHSTGQKLNYIVTGLLALAVVFIAVDDYWLDDPATESASGSPAASRPAASTAAGEPRRVLANSVAVLPFENLSPDPANAFYANGLHAEVIGQLTKLRNLTVINRESMLPYAENRPSLRRIAEDLGEQSLLTGRFQYAEGRIRVGVELVDPTSGANLWNEAYEREYAEIFSVQADIAMNVANALNAEFSDEEQRRIEQEPTSSPAAYALYLQSRSLTGVGEQGPRMQELLDQAIEIDPDFALAYGFLAAYYSQALINTSEGSARTQAELEPLIRENAGKALALDAEVSAAWGALGNLASYSWRWTEAREAYDRISDIGPPGTWFRAWSGDPAEGVRIAARWVELNPLFWTAHWSHGIALNYAGDYDSAAAKFRDGIALAPTLSLQHSWLATNEIALGDTEEARRELQVAERLLGENRSVLSLVDTAYGYGRIGDRANALRLFDEISAVAEGGADIGVGSWALLHLAVEETDEALEWLERGAEKARRHELDAGYYSLMNIKMNFTDDPVLERPEFAEVRAQLKGD